MFSYMALEYTNMIDEWEHVDEGEHVDGGALAARMGHSKGDLCQ